METKEIIILNTDEDAAQLKTVTGWVSRDGRFYGSDERAARYAGCTHYKCECGNLMGKGWTKCESCRNSSSIERYKAYEFKEWDEEQPVCDYDGDNYFFSAEEIDDYLENNELEASDLMLVLCEANNLYEISSEYWDDVLPEDGEIPKELEQKLDELNKFIATLGPISWTPSKIRTEYKPAE